MWGIYLMIRRVGLLDFVGDGMGEVSAHDSSGGNVMPLLVSRANIAKTA